MASSCAAAACGAALVAAGGGGAHLAVVAQAGGTAVEASASAAATPLDSNRALLLPVAQLLDQGGDEDAARALTYGIAAEVAGPHGVRTVKLAESGSRSSGTALLHVNWDASNAHAVCAALASELLKAQASSAAAAGAGAAPRDAAPTAAGGGAAPTAAQLRNAQSAVHAFHRLVQNTKTSLGWNFLAQLFPDYDDSRLEAVWRGVSGKDAVRLVLPLGEPEGFGDCEDMFGEAQHSEAQSESGVSCEDMDAADDAQHDEARESSTGTDSSEDSTLAAWRKHKEDQAAVVWALACKAL